MPRALLLRRLLLLRGGAGGGGGGSCRAASSYTVRHASAAPSYYAAATANAAAAQAEANAAAAAAAAAPESSSSSSSAGAGEQPAASAPPPPAARGLWGLLKYGALAAVTAAVGGVGYVSYAYTLDEVEQKTREFRKHPAPTVPKDASEFEKFKAMMYSTAMKVPVAAIDLYLDARSTIEDHVRGFTEPTSDKLLPDLLPQEEHLFTLVLDLNETLVYSDWQMMTTAEMKSYMFTYFLLYKKCESNVFFAPSVKRERGWRTFKRPGVDAFLEHMAKFYEVVVYSDQPPMYVDPVLERLDSKGYIRYRLSRPATKYQDGKHFRDLSKLNRNPARVIYISAHCHESCMQPENCVEIKPWTLESNDTKLLDLIPFLEYVAMAGPKDIRQVLASYQGHDIAAEFIERSKEHQRGVFKNKGNMDACGAGDGS
ncbi:hypothetical protein ACP4OV_031597 [Aristida adscensionis]